MQDTWKLNTLYQSEKDPQIQKDIDKGILLAKKFVEKWKKDKEYTKNPEILKNALDDYEQLERNSTYIKPYLYFRLRAHLDQTNPAIKAENNKLDDISTKLGNEMQFFDLNISKIPKNKQSQFLNYKGLEPYKHYLEHSFRGSQYLLSDKEEKVFNLTSKTSYGNWVDMMNELLDKQELTVVDEKNKRQKIHYNDTAKYINSSIKKVRDYSANEYNKINEKYMEIAEFEINSILEKRKVSEEYRKIPRPDTLRHISDDIETEIVDTLINAVTKNFDISQSYYQKKAQLLGQKHLAYYERTVPAGKISKQYTFDEAIDLVKDTFNGIDPQFGDIVSTFEALGQYDVYPKKGKSGGAFCLSWGRDFYPYILLNFANRLEDVLTIAHESGHGIHDELSKKQNALNDGTPISLAEVASTFFEDFVLNRLLKDTKDKTEKEALLEKSLNDNVSTIFRQVAFYNFEKDLHKDFNEKGFLPKEYISELFCKHMKAYMGEAVLEDDSMRTGWIYISHFRRPFYVYSYASGLLISKALQEMVREDKKNIKYVKTFLESGSSKSPKELFLSMGIDITKETFWEKGIDNVRKELNNL